jgi:hypothetical protein
MRNFLAVLVVAMSVLCLASQLEAGQPKVYARVETGSGVWTVESGYLENKCWLLCLRTAQGVKLDSKPLGGGIGSTRIQRIQMQANSRGGVNLLMVTWVARRNWSRWSTSITDNNYNRSTGIIERRILDKWPEL